MSGNSRDRKWGDAPVGRNAKKSGEEEEVVGRLDAEEFPDDSNEADYDHIEGEYLDDATDDDLYTFEDPEDTDDEKKGATQGTKHPSGLEIPVLNPKKSRMSTGYSECLIYGSANIIQGAVLGLAIGGVQGVFVGITSGMHRQPGFGGAVWHAAKSSGVQFGVWLGVYSGCRCALAVTRRKDDKLNVFGGGFAAGCVATLRTRNPALIVTNGVASGLIVTILEAIGGIRL